MPGKGNPKKLKPFKKGHDPRRNLAGRPPNILQTIQVEGYKATNILQCYAKILALNDEEIQQVMKDPGSTQLEKILAKGMERARGTGDYWRLEQVVTRLLGAPTQHLSQTVKTLNFKDAE